MSDETRSIPDFWLPAAAEATSPPAARRKRILIGKPGLDGHDRGAKYVAHILRDAGYEVIYTGIRRTPEQIVASAIQEDVDAVGLSLLSGAHNLLFARILELLREQGAEDIAVFGGGVIPDADARVLKEQGVAQVFGPGSSLKAIAAWLEEQLDQREDEA